MSPASRAASGPRRSLARQLLPIALIFGTIVCASLALTLGSIAVQSAVRGYVTGEGHWSKAQRDAVHLLERYGRSWDPQDFHRARAALAIPLGDRVAREALQRPDLDWRTAHDGFIAGANHPDDVAGMIALFRCCSDLPYLRRVIALWTDGDTHIEAIATLAERLRGEIERPAPSRERIDALLGRIVTVNDQVQPLADAFSATLGDAARWVSRLLTLATTTITLLMIALGGYLSKRVVDDIRRSENQYRTLMDSASDGLMVVDDGGAVLEVNERLERMAARSAASLVGRPCAGLFGIVPATLAGLPADAPARARAPALGTLSVGADASLDVEVNCSVTQWNGRRARLAIVRDIGDRLRAERDLRIAANAMANLAEGVVITDERLRIVSVNPAFTTITGYAAAEALGRSAIPAARGGERRAALREARQGLRSEGAWSGEIETRRKDGGSVPLKASLTTLRDPSGTITHRVCVFTDHSRFREYERRLHHMARHDALTGLPNRESLEERGRDAIRRAAQRGHRLATLFIDLDGFKAVNDSYGHRAGDRLLAAVAQRIVGSLRARDLVARVGGDEFVVLLESDPSDAGVTSVTRVLLAEIATPVVHDGQSMGVSASIGIACYPDDGDAIDALLARADIAMYAAKERGRNNFQRFGAEMADAHAARLALANGLKAAIDSGSLHLHFQPVVDLRAATVVGVEALARWTDPRLGAIGPDVFVALAETSGLIDRLSDWVLREACEQAVRWRAEGRSVGTLAVNLSPRNFWDPDLPDRIRATLASTGWPAEQLCLEITESAVMDGERPEAILQRLADMGVQLAVDDFGVGHSSLNQLRRFPVDMLKLDRSFVRNLADDAGTRAIVETIVALSRGLDLTVLAEGVETDAQHRALVELGCDLAQGWLYSRAAAADQVAPLLGARIAAAAPRALALADASPTA